MMTNARNRRLISIFFWSVALVQMSAQKVSFPGIKTQAKSPDGHYVVKNVDDENREPAHTLTLMETTANKVMETYEYRRHVDVLWSPASDAFVVNDYEGSDASHPVLFTKPWTAQPIDLRERLLTFLGTQVATKGMLSNLHVYLLAQRWLADGDILCRVTGYGDADPKGFRKDFVYKVGEGFRATSR